METNTKKYNLEKRLLDYSCSILKIVDLLPSTRTGMHISGQLLRSGTSPYPNHGEAQAAESPKDFIHKMRICLKELRETFRWLNLIKKAVLVQQAANVDDLIIETEELIKIFYASIKTARNNSSK